MTYSVTALVPFLVYCQALGAAVGACTAVWAELSYVRAMRDGALSSAETRHLRIIGHGLKYGMTLLLLSSLGLIVAAYLTHAAFQPAVSSGYWSLMMLALLIISVSSMLVRRRLPFQLASATLFTAWWFLVYLSFGFLSLTFGAAVMAFVVATVVFNAIIYFTRMLALP
jgi:hypothetical protein